MSDLPQYEDELQRLRNSEDIGFGNAFDKFMNGLFDISIPHWVLGMVEVLLWVVIISVIVWLLYKEIMLANSERSTGDGDIKPHNGGMMGTAKDADIRGHDFDEELRLALLSEDYALAVNLRYLMALKMLDEQGRVAWKDYKTPMMYVEEITTGKRLLERLTRMFLYIKYGHYPATKEVYDDAVALYETLSAGEEGGTDGE